MKIRNEIGSEFWSIPTTEEENRLFPEETHWFISGTAALQAILSDITSHQSVRTAAVPSWCCSCMIEPFLQKGIGVRFYPVFCEPGHGLVCDFRAAEGCDVTLRLSYFGYSVQKNLGEPSGIQIRDLTHSVFSEQFRDAEYSFGSLRKWAGFYTGGYAWGRWNREEAYPQADAAYLALRKKAMEEKLRYLQGVSGSKAYLDLFDRAEDYLDSCSVQGSCSRDVEAAKRLDLATIRSRRRENAAILLEAFRDLAVFPEPAPQDCPLFVPILVPDGKRNALRSWLISREIYCPVHWPVSPVHRLDARTSALYEQELSLVCDQRYTGSDMDRMVTELQRFLGS